MINRGGIGPNSLLDGAIELRGILGSAVEHLGTRIAAGEWGEGEAVTREADLVDQLGVSRSVIRESFRILGAKGMIRSKTSDGTRIQPRAKWRLLDPDVMEWRIKAGDTESLLRDLLKLRLVMEPGIAYLAAQSAHQEHIERVKAAWQAKQYVYDNATGSHEARREAFITTDLEFHRALIGAVQSELLEQLFSVIEAALGLLLDLQMTAKGYTSTMIGMDESHALHERVFQAFIARDPEATEAAMRTLIQCAIDDAKQGFQLLDQSPGSDGAVQRRQSG